MSRAPAEVDALGNLNPHYQEGLRIPVSDVGLDNQQIDISAKNWVFKTSALTIPLIPNPDDPLGLLLVLTLANVQTLPVEGTSFVIVDTDADPDDVRWEGKITPRGWK